MTDEKGRRPTEDELAKRLRENLRRRKAPADRTSDEAGPSPREAR